jgi:serine/threonine kinase 38
MNHEKHFSFPDEPSISNEAKDLISKLICDSELRLGRNGMSELKSHAWFKGFDWDSITERTYIIQIVFFLDTF